jgi:hypothetical protein
VEFKGTREEGRKNVRVGGLEFKPQLPALPLPLPPKKLLLIAISLCQVGAV